MTEIGIHCTNPEALQQRLVVWEGVDIISRTLADPDYAEVDEAPLVLPRGEYRAASAEETLGFMATAETKRTMQLCRLPRQLGDAMLNANRNAPPFIEGTPYEQLAEHIVGRHTGMRYDSPGQLTVSLKNTAHPDKAEPIKVGYHIDARSNEDFTYSIINAGPGNRWHCVAPDCTRATIGSARRDDRIHYFENNPENNVKIYGVRLEPPTETYVEVLFNSPVAYALHDGSTIDASEGSSVAFIASDPVALGVYPSPLTGTA